jgi:hypothetical protein
MMSSTCFKLKGSSSGRWLHVQVWYDLFTCQQYKVGVLYVADYKTGLSQRASLCFCHIPHHFPIPSTPNPTVIILSVIYCPWSQTALSANLILYCHTSQFGWQPSYMGGIQRFANLTFIVISTPPTGKF